MTWTLMGTCVCVCVCVCADRLPVSLPAAAAHDIGVLLRELHMEDLIPRFQHEEVCVCLCVCVSQCRPTLSQQPHTCLASAVAFPHIHEAYIQSPWGLQSLLSFVVMQVTPSLLAAMDDAALNELGVVSVGAKVRLRFAANTLFGGA